MIRLDRLLAERGAGSRREVAAAIRHGRVHVDGEVLRKPSLRVSETAELRLDGVVLPPLPMVVAWHKPRGVVSTLRDPWGRPSLEGVLPEPWDGMLHPVGRLDAETTGLLLFSRDGQLTQRLLHPRRGVPRRYVAGVETLPPDLHERLTTGVGTSDGTFTAEDICISDHDVTLTVREGKHRMVRRMLANAGAPVLTLHRVSYGAVQLAPLAEGEARALTPAEVQALAAGAW
ncbi:MAG: pseudouridine synthase [Myxococcota bacterium]